MQEKSETKHIDLVLNVWSLAVQDVPEFLGLVTLINGSNNVCKLQFNGNFVKHLKAA